MPNHTLPWVVLLPAALVIVLTVVGVHACEQINAELDPILGTDGPQFLHWLEAP